MLNDIKPLLYGARIFGCVPHKLDDHNLIMTKRGTIYSALVGLFIVSSVGYGVYDSLNIIDISFSARVLIAVRGFLYLITTIADGIITILRNDRLNAALENLRVYDISAEFNDKTNYVTVKFLRFSVVVLLSCWSVVAYFSYVSESRSPLLHGVNYGIVNAIVSLQILKFCGIMWLLYQRLNHLSQLVLPKEPTKLRINVINGDWRVFELQDIWRMHCCLSKAAEKINEVYSIQLLLWITTMSLSELGRIHTLTSLVVHRKSLRIREILAAIACIIHLILITASCHFTSHQANSLAAKVFSFHRAILRSSGNNENKMDAAMYFCIKKLQFTAAAGFIDVHLPLLISIASVLTTYIVILHK